ncbi:hypothetical protein E2562_036375 [Oryza meyeriana var. granulata]|uniref:TF-B3 domain-containing protein n=1 Tax=Oryza meyeriana var. granulata TaxID=110450 RepID=A0A6G1FG04_9ORYZ|nr:hypothetical protein E2562_036375 [Oryza meyeriana var. granulata]
MAEDQNHAGEAPPHADHAAVPPPTPPLGPHERLVLLLQQLGVRDLVCKLRKQVDSTDARPNQSRLQLTYALARDLVESGDLTDGEKESIHGQKNPGLKLVGYDRDGARYEAMRFSKVGSINSRNGNGLYRLKGFGKFVAAAGLEAGHTVVAWVFRLPVPAPAQEEEAAPSSAEQQPAPARLAVVLLNYASMDPEEVEERVRWEEKALIDAGAVRGLLELANGRQVDN